MPPRRRWGLPRSTARQFKKLFSIEISQFSMMENETEEDDKTNQATKKEARRPPSG